MRHTNTPRQPVSSPPSPDFRGAVFLDRDGTIIREVDYLRRLEDLELLEGVGPAIAELNRLAIPVILVSNQSGIARGFFDEEFVNLCHRELQRRLAPFGARIDDFFFCPHHPSAGRPPYRKMCNCRKPAPGMLAAAAVRHKLDLNASFVIGDKECDLELARAAGAHGILVETGYGLKTAASLKRQGRVPVTVCRDLAAAVAWLKARLMRIPATRGQDER